MWVDRIVTIQFNTSYQSSRMPIPDNATKKYTQNVNKPKDLSHDAIEKAWANYAAPYEANWDNYSDRPYVRKIDSTTKSKR